MCRLSAITSSEYFSPMENIHALETMKEGHAGPGLGLMLKDLGGPFEEFKGFPFFPRSVRTRAAGLGRLHEGPRVQGEVHLGPLH